VIVYSTEGARIILQAITYQAAEIGLFIEDADLEAVTVRGSDVKEPSVKGYERQTLRPSDWRIDDALSASTHSKVVFDFTGPPGMLYGYFVVKTTGEILFSERFQRPFDFSEFGGRIGIIPTLRLRNKEA
jgi:hypothetical protein